MKVQAHGAVIKSSSDFESNSFRIAASPHAFRVLSSGLYSNKIRAVIREISCNAWDSHVEAGVADVPFKVTLPNRLSPTFSVRDFGVGLSLETAMEL